MVGALPRRLLLWGYVAVLVGTLLAGTVGAWLLTPYPSPLNLNDDPLIHGGFDVAVCAVAALSFVGFLVLRRRAARQINGVPSSWEGRAKDLTFVAITLFFARGCGHEAALDGPVVSNGVLYPLSPSSHPEAMVAIAIVLLLLAVILGVICFIEGVRALAAR
jgi:hypothetical protein